MRPAISDALKFDDETQIVFAKGLSEHGVPLLPEDVQQSVGVPTRFLLVQRGLLTLSERIFGDLAPVLPVSGLHLTLDKRHQTLP